MNYYLWKTCFVRKNDVKVLDKVISMEAEVVLDGEKKGSLFVREKLMKRNQTNPIMQ